MSNAQVSKILKIDSVNELYTLVKDKRDTNSFLIPFVDRMEMFLYGCPCDSEKHWDQAISEYKIAIKSDFTNLKKEIGCTLIHFYLDDEFLSER